MAEGGSSCVQAVIGAGIAKLGEAISSEESSFREIVLACKDQDLITSKTRRQLLNPWKSIQARATDLINHIQTLVGDRPECLDEFLSILVVKGGILGLDESTSTSSSSEGISLDHKTFIFMDCLQMKFTDDIMVLLALEGQKVEDVAGYFDMEDYINQIDQEKSEIGKIVSILSMWKETKGINATYHTVIEKFFLSNRHKIAMSVAINVHKKYSTPSLSSPVNEALFRPEKSFSNWNDFDDNHKVRIRHNLREENDKISDLFGERFLNILNSIEKNVTHFDELKSFLERKLSKELPSHLLIKLRESKDVIDIFKFIRSIGCNWFNYHLLDVLTYHYGGDEDKQMMSDYVKRLWAYLQRSLYRIPPESFGPSQITDAYHFILPIADGNDMSGQQLKQIQLMLAKRLEIPPHIQIEIGTVTLIHFIVSKDFKVFNVADAIMDHKSFGQLSFGHDCYMFDWCEPRRNISCPGYGCIDDPVSCILQHYSGRLSQIALPLEVVQLLYMEGVIDRETCDGVMSSGGPDLPISMNISLHKLEQLLDVAFLEQTICSVCECCAKLDQMVDSINNDDLTRLTDLTKEGANREFFEKNGTNQFIQHLKNLICKMKGFTEEFHLVCDHWQKCQLRVRDDLNKKDYDSLRLWIEGLHQSIEKCNMVFSSSYFSRNLSKAIEKCQSQADSVSRKKTEVLAVSMTAAGSTATAGVAASIVAGIFTFGIGTAVGLAVTGAAVGVAGTLTAATVTSIILPGLDKASDALGDLKQKLIDINTILHSQLPVKESVTLLSSKINNLMAVIKVMDSQDHKFLCLLKSKSR